MLRGLLLFTIAILASSAPADECDSRLATGGHYLDSLLLKAARDPHDPDVLTARAALTVGTTYAATQLGTLGRNFDLLALHPGVASRLPRFLGFVQAHPVLAREGPAAALTAFRAELGRVGLSRAILLNEAEREGVLQNGLIPNFVRTKTGDEAQMYLWLARMGLGFAIDRHMCHEGAKTSPLASFSQQQDLARLVVNVPPDQDRLRYVWRISLDELDVVFVHASGDLIEEALVFAFIPPERFDRLNETAGERYHVSIADMLEDRRFTRFGGDLLISEHNLPHVERPSRKTNGEAN